VPAAAVIPALIVYIKVVAVKKLVVGFRGPFSGIHPAFFLFFFLLIFRLGEGLKGGGGIGPVLFPGPFITCVTWDVKKFHSFTV